MNRILQSLCAGVITIATAVAAPGDLANAAERGNLTEVRRLLASGSIASEAQADGMTALHWAVQSNHQPMVNTLLGAGANVNAANRYGITPLWLAATNGNAAVVRALLKAGADVKASMPHGETALMAAARTGEPETIQVLLDAGADPNVQESHTGESGLMWAAAENHGEAIRLLIKGGANPDLHAKALDLPPMDWQQIGMVSTPLPSGGFTAMMYAARQDAKDAVMALMESGANPNERDPDGTTALQYAIINQHFDLAVMMIEKGADSSVADNSGMSAIYAAVDMSGFRSDIGRPTRKLLDTNTALDVVKAALKRGGNPNVQLTKVVLGRHHGFGDNQLNKGATALMRAAKGNDLEMMQVLLEGGADAKLGMENGSSPILLLAAARLGPGPNGAAKITEALELLARHGADLNAKNNRGQTALHVAASAGSDAIVRVLAEHGADLEATDSQGKTALDLVSAPGRGRHESTEALLKELIAARTAKP